MRMTLMLPAILAAVFCALPLRAEPQALTLQQAIDKTLQHNPQLHQFKFTQQRLLAEREVQSLKPGYQLGVDLENVAGTGEARGLAGAELTVALSSVIELDNKAQWRAAVVDARLNTLEWQQQAQTLDVLAELTRNYINLLASQQELTLTEEAVELSEALLQSAEKRAASGALSDAEIMRAKAQLAQVQIGRDALLQRIERQKIAIARFWGDTSANFNVVAGNLFAFGQSRPFAELYQRLQQSPALTIFASERRLKDAEVRLAQSQNRADLSWQVGVRRYQASDDTGLTFGISVPLFAERRNSAAIEAALAERNNVEYRQQDSLLILHERLFDAYSQRQQFITSHQQLAQYVIPNLEQALDLTRDAFQRGRSNYQDWLNAQQELLQAKRQILETATAVLLSQATIEQLTAEPVTQ